MNRFLCLSLAVLLLFSTGCKRNRIPRNDLSKFFTEFQVRGGILVYDQSEDTYYVCNQERSVLPFLPASTFKIFNSLVALETGAVKDVDEVLKWDGKERMREQWNQDLNMRQAMEYSAVWFYQEMARRIGAESMEKWVKEAGYGNQNIGGDLDMFWLNGELRITQQQQLQFLQKLYNNELPFSEKTMEQVKEIMLVEEGEGFKLFGKTGWASSVEPNIGWFVGYLEKGENVYFFATNFSSSEPDDNFSANGKTITKKILAELEFYPGKSI